MDQCTSCTSYISAVRNNHVVCLESLYRENNVWHELVCAQAAYFGHLHCLKYAHQHGCPWDELTCTYAIYGNSIDCLKYARDNNCPWNITDCITCDPVDLKMAMKCEYLYDEIYMYVIENYNLEQNNIFITFCDLIDNTLYSTNLVSIIKRSIII